MAGVMQVKTAAEDCLAMLVRSLPPTRVLHVLVPIVERSQNTIQLAAINMMSEVGLIPHCRGTISLPIDTDCLIDMHLFLQT